jgi:hypothetical protein
MILVTKVVHFMFGLELFHFNLKVLIILPYQFLLMIQLFLISLQCVLPFHVIDDLEFEQFHCMVVLVVEVNLDQLVQDKVLFVVF